MNDIKLRFVNDSDADRGTSVIILQKNYATSIDEFLVAWKVIRNCAKDCYHPFTYSNEIEINVMDTYGNYTIEKEVEPGQQYEMVKRGFNDILTLKGEASSPVEVEVVNNLKQGAITVNALRSGRLLARKAAIPPCQKAVFQFKPFIYVGAVSEVVKEGQVFESAIISQINTEFSLIGISRADIIMTGGGVGSTATSYQFSLANVEWL